MSALIARVSPAAQRIAVNAGGDAALAALACLAAALLANPAGPVPGPFSLLWAAVAMLLAGVPFGLSIQYWRFAGAPELLAVAASSALAAALTTLGLHVSRAAMLSQTFPVIDGLCLVVLLSASRGAYRYMHGAARDVSVGKPVLLIGAGEVAARFLGALDADPATELRAIGLLSLGDRQTGRRINGCPILGGLPDATAVLDRVPDVELLVIAAPDLVGARLAELLALADARGLRVARAPNPTVLSPATEPAGGTELRPVAIEELLNRRQVPLDRAGMGRLVAGRRVLVTGAGGTIGSELARQVAALRPASLTLVDNGEYALWQIDTELAETHADVARRALVADVRDAARMRRVFTDTRPALVFHAAALKHVPIVEANPLEGLLTNAVGTRNVADAARAAGVGAMVVISTDKAVNPSSVMGASKRLAEMYCQGLDADADSGQPGMACITVRFGNVLGSTGSVVPLFQHQLAHGGPLTVTHPDMRRYFMTVREAVGLVLQAAVTATAIGTVADPTGAKPNVIPGGGIFVLDMGEPVRIVDLARQIIRLAGLRPDIDVAITFTGLRPGEKLSEELFHDREPAHPIGIPGLLMAHPRHADAAVVGRAIDAIEACCRAGDWDGALAALTRTVQETAGFVAIERASV